MAYYQAVQLEPGQTLQHYRLVEKIGEGGMGVVWKAVDTSLDREVAIKVLPDVFSDDPERLTRFEREARLLASLSHANIASIFGLHAAETPAGAVRFLAMELVRGEDLAQRLARGPVPIDEALGIALQIAEALEAAHESGVIHRDLKPANIRIGADNQVKVLDFGLAKAFVGDPMSASTDSSLSPTMTSSGTLAGMILGTAAYMSSEQAKGKPVDKRADVWAFGCVLYEMLSGTQTFTGETVSETLASVIKEQPDWEALPDGTPGRLRRLLRRCLDKEPRQRLRDIGDARITVAEIMAGETGDESAGSVAEPSAAPRPSIWIRALPWALVAVLAAILIWNGTARRPATSDPRPDHHLSIVLAESEPVFLANHDFELMPSLAISPSSDRVVYVSTDTSGPFTGAGNTSKLRVRSLNGFDSEALVGGERGEQPFFSPDGRWIGFFRDNDLAKIPVGGGAPVVLSPTGGPGNGASWGSDGTIVYAEGYSGPLWRVPESGGEPVAVTTLADDERSHRYPQILPDGKSVVFTVKPAGILTFDDARIAVANLTSGEHRTLLEGGMYGRYVESGHLVYARNDSLLAAPFDLERLEITGGAVPVLDGVITNPITGSAMFACSPGGTLVFASGDYRTGVTSVFAVDREIGTRRILVDDRFASFPHLSPDERRLVMHGSAAHDQILVLDLERETLLRVSDTSGNNILPIWGPDDERVVFTTDRSGEDEIVWMPAGGGGPMETLVDVTGLPQDAGSWSHDGRLLAFNRGIRSVRDIWVLDLDSGAAEPFLDSPFYEGEPAFSPDAKWIAYTSNESGTSEIFVSPYPGPGGKIQVSSGGGMLPRWRGDGAELFYATETAIVAMPMTWSTGPRPGRPQPLFEVNGRVPVGYDVTRDGKTFYVAEFDESRLRSSRIDLILNWFDTLP